MTEYKEFVMLVLSRKQGESIVIANDIVVNIVDIGRGRVQIGVTAPPHYSVNREEIHRRIQLAKSAAPQTRAPSLEAACNVGFRK
jgi:carbon storage regulator